MAKEKILVVEDEDTTRAVVVAELEKAEYQVFEAQDGKEALQVAKAVRPDLVVCDIVMPEMDGNQFIKKLRESGFGRGVLFIILTSHGQMRDYFEMMNVDDFITKPVDPEELLARVERVLAKEEGGEQVSDQA